MIRSLLSAALAISLLWAVNWPAVAANPPTTAGVPTSAAPPSVSPREPASSPFIEESSFTYATPVVYDFTDSRFMAGLIVKVPAAAGGQVQVQRVRSYVGPTPLATPVTSSASALATATPGSVAAPPLRSTAAGDSASPPATPVPPATPTAQPAATPTLTPVTPVAATSPATALPTAAASPTPLARAGQQATAPVAREALPVLSSGQGDSVQYVGEAAAPKLSEWTFSYGNAAAAQIPPPAVGDMSVAQSVARAAIPTPAPAAAGQSVDNPVSKPTDHPADAAVGASPVEAVRPLMAYAAQPAAQPPTQPKVVTTWSALEPSYQDASPLPVQGKAMYYNPGIMGQVLDYRLRLDQVTACPECVGYAALLRKGDINRKVWIQWPGGEVDGPYLVVDVAAKHHVSLLLARDWVVDVDYKTAVRRGMNRPLPVTVLASPPAAAPALVSELLPFGP